MQVRIKKKDIEKIKTVLGKYKNLLENINQVGLKVVRKNNSLLIFLSIKGDKQEKFATITMNELDSPIMQSVAVA